MQFMDDSLLPENQIRWSSRSRLTRRASAAGFDDIAVSMKDQVQKAVDCYNAGATVLHVHVREPDGKGSKRLEMFNEMLDRCAPRCRDDPAGRRLDQLRSEGRRRGGQVAGRRHAHMLAELNPNPTRSPSRSTPTR